MSRRTFMRYQRVLRDRQTIRAGAPGHTTKRPDPMAELASFVGPEWSALADTLRVAFPAVRRVETARVPHKV